MPRTTAVVIGAVEGNFGRGDSSRAVVGVERLAAPCVIRLVRINAGLEHVLGRACIITHYKDDVCLVAAGQSRELGNVNTTGPVGWVSRVVRHIQYVRARPITLEQEGVGVDHRACRLLRTAQLNGRHHAAAAEAAVPPHPEDLDAVRTVGGVGKQADAAPTIDTCSGSISLDLMIRGAFADLPSRSAQFRVFGLDWVTSKRVGRQQNWNDEE